MNFNIERFALRYHIPTFTSGFKQCSKGWIHLDCPYCSGNPGPHLGWNISKGYFNCFRCGFHSVNDVVQTLCHVDYRGAKEIIKEFGGQSTENRRQVIQRPDIRPQVRAQASLPPGCAPVEEMHIAYLEKRKLDPDLIIPKYKLLGTGWMSSNGWGWRLVIPVYQDGVITTYTTRDITNKSEIRYKACPADWEAVNIKDTVYGLNFCKTDSVVIVEGAFDVFRLGDGAVCGWGIEWRDTQRILLERFHHRYVMFDGGEPGALKAAFKLAHALEAFGGENEVLELTQGDPSDFTQLTADRLMEELGAR